MNFDEAFAANPELEKNGVWIPFGDEMKFLIASSDTKEYRKRARELLQPYRAITRGGRDLPDGIDEQITIKVMSELVLLDWAGVKNPDGSLVQYTQAESVKRMTERPKFRNWVAEQSGSIVNFQRAANEVAEKKS